MVATIKSREHALGFKWKAHGGMHKATDTPLPLVEQAIEELTEELSDARVSNRHVIPDEDELDSIDEHFDRIGPELWPNEGSNRNAWLVDANEENFGGLYPRNLYFSVPEDYELLRERFQDLLMYKVGIRLYEQRLYEQRRKEVPCENQDSSAINQVSGTAVAREDESPSAPDQTSCTKPQKSFSPATLRKHTLKAFLQSESSESEELTPEVLVAIAAAVVDDQTTYKWRGTSYNVPEHMLAIGKEVIEQFSKAPGDKLHPAVSSANGRCEVIDLDLLSSDNEEEYFPEERTPSSPEILSSQHNRAMPRSLAEMQALLSTINFEVQYRLRQDESPIVSLRDCYTSAKLFERIQASIPEDAQIREVQAFIVYFQRVREIRVRKGHEPDFQKLVHRMICEDVHEGFVAIEW